MGAVYSLAGDTADVGMDGWSPVTDAYDPWDNAFTGTITHRVNSAERVYQPSFSQRPDHSIARL